MARRKDHTREELNALILEAAWQIVLKEGLPALTARRLGTEIGYAAGTIYNFFASMDELYLQLNARVVDMLYDVLSDPACLDPKKSPVQNMRTMSLRYMDFARRYRPLWLMLFNVQLPEDRQHMQWYQEKIDRLFVPLEQLLTSYYKKGQEDTRRMAARILWSSVHGLCFLQETGKIPVIGKKSAAAEMAEYLIDTFVAGIAKSK